MAEFKKAEEKDAQQIVELIKEEFPYIKASAENVKERMNAENIQVFKLEDEKRLVGFIEMELLGEETARINALAVREDQRGKDYGKILLKEALKFLEGHDVSIVTLLVREDNKKAVKLYEEAGFEAIGLFETEDGMHIQEMELEVFKGTPKYVS